MEEGGIMADRWTFSAHVSITVAIEDFRVAGAPTLSARAAPPSG